MRRALLLSVLLSGCAMVPKPPPVAEEAPAPYCPSGGYRLPDYPDAGAVSPCVYEGPAWVPGLYALRERAALCLYTIGPRADAGPGVAP